MTVESHAPLPVRIVSEGRESYPAPELNDDWSDLDKLRWCAGVVEARTGVRINIVSGDVLSIGGATIPGRYGYAYLRGGGGAYDFESMWTFLHGVELGARLAKGAA